MFLYNLLELTFSFLANQIEWDWSKEDLEKEIIIIIMHSKYVSISDWLNPTHNSS